MKSRRRFKAVPNVAVRDTRTNPKKFSEKRAHKYGKNDSGWLTTGYLQSHTQIFALQYCTEIISLTPHGIKIFQETLQHRASLEETCFATDIPHHWPTRVHFSSSVSSLCVSGKFEGSPARSEFLEMHTFWYIVDY